ncbi:MAG TPA: peptidylprolyl isomerase, partial [Burkholderiaceae bacterium]|nr:peptidylprolyl isomerase [Burkholderiaceae bacterium]
MNITVNGATVDAEKWPTPRLAAVHELLRQRARELGLLDTTANEDETKQAIERTLAREVAVPVAQEEECRRWYEANATRFRSGDLVFARHILFQVTPGVPVPAVRAVAEAILHEIRRDSALFDKHAREHSNCPSGATGGQLGQLQRGDTVPEFEKAIFEDATIGVLPKLVATRYGFHIIAVDKRVEG